MNDAATQGLEGGCDGRLVRYRMNSTPPTFLDVIPAEAGIHLALGRKAKWIPAFAGMTSR